MVCAATDDLLGGRVAIKKIKPISGDSWDAKHVLRELRLMRQMEHHPNVISLLDLNIVEAMDELYIVMELMDSDLHKIIQSKQGLSTAHCQVLMKQVSANPLLTHSCSRANPKNAPRFARPDSSWRERAAPEQYSSQGPQAGEHSCGEGLPGEDNGFWAGSVHERV